MTYNPNEKIGTTAIRVSLMERGALGPVLGLSLDELKPEDELFHVQGLTFVMDKNLLEQCGSINIDFVEDGDNPGFKVTAENPLLSANDNYSSAPYQSWGVYH